MLGFAFKINISRKQEVKKMDLKKPYLLLGAITLAGSILSACGADSGNTVENENDQPLEVSKPEVEKEKSNSSNKSEEKEKSDGKLFTVIADTKPYGNDTYDPKGILLTYTEEAQPKKPDSEMFGVYEVDGRVEVYWIDDINNDIYRSVAENNKWIEAGVKIGDIDTPNDVMPLFVGRTVFNKVTEMGKHKITGLTFDENGKLVNESVIDDTSDNYGEGFTSNGEKAAIIGNKLYSANNIDNPVQLNDKYSLIRGSNPFYYDAEKKNLTFGGGDLYEYKHMNIETGEPLYDSNGKDATLGGLKSDMEDSLLIGGFDSNILLYSVGNYLHLFDDKFQEIISIRADTDDAKELNSTDISVTEDEIHIWTSEEFQRQQVLRLKVIGKSTTGVESEQ